MPAPVAMLIPPDSFIFFVEYLFELYVSGLGRGEIVLRRSGFVPGLFIGLLLFYD